MWIIPIIIFIVIALLCSIFIYFCCIVGARADKRKEDKKIMIATCEKCHNDFTWTEDDAIIKYYYGAKYIVHCPHCDKLTKIDKEI